MNIDHTFVSKGARLLMGEKGGARANTGKELFYLIRDHKRGMNHDIEEVFYEAREY